MINLTNADFLQNSVNNAYGQLSQPLQSVAAGSQLNGPSENPSDYVLSQSLLSQLNGTQQADANVQEGMNLLQTASDGMSNSLGAGNQSSVPTGNITPGNLSLSGVGTATQSQAESAISTVQNAIPQVSSQQANLGAAQVGLSSMAASLANSAVNTTSALSQVNDADFASESTSAASAKVKLQRSIYALPTANQEKGQVLDLLA